MKSKQTTILIADSRQDDVAELIQQLSSSDFRVTFCDSKRTILSVLASERADILMMNLKQQDSDGISICQEVRSLKTIHQPFLIIYNDTAEDYIQITSYNSGADIFLTKPLNPVIISARLKALMKRSTGSSISLKNESTLYIDFETYQIVRNSKRFSLPKKEFEIFSYLFSIPKKVFSRKEIAQKIWGDERVASQRTIDIHIRNIRKIIGKDVVRTIKGMGYSIG